MCGRSSRVDGVVLGASAATGAVKGTVQCSKKAQAQARSERHSAVQCSEKGRRCRRRHR